ncbi:D-alanyl-D-alanine carboxypeptidase [Bacillus luteolus]|uniref:D-alanyl-D-alanine carboxypeptidase n=1 Tax=Litchfieldia luteola TaxID=682179 RepID=A0ABR9QEI3_9BACI|nr:D-alanyl-D-alanine carboxypeptidase family protein [Cytobacillus luteolus]MBE4906907.1 D-alanyl-D-alanine carboxypeptidase [Cytobacillus luteolus]MBP1943630.1 D-alanyl-D-alanine carboxypeptidase [Cytobacillus luteolus]
MKYYSIFLMLTISVFFFFPAYHYAEDNSPSVQSESAVLMDAKTGSILYEKNSSARMYPASVTKIATAIVAIEEGKLDDIVTVSENARYVEGTRVYLEPGEQVSLIKLVQGLLINSGNDAGVAIAEHMDGSVEDFSKRMNQFLKEKVGIHDTNFVNPHGLYHDQHYTTAYDIALLTSYALKNDTFKEIFSTNELEWKGESWDTVIYNHHEMLTHRPYEGIVGGKNGYVQKSGHTLATVAERENLTLVAVTMKTNLKSIIYKDTAALLDYGFENFKTTVIPSTKVFKDKQNNNYYPTNSVYYTHKINEIIKQKVTNEGELLIKGEDNRVLSVTKLNPVAKLSDRPVSVLASTSIEKEQGESKNLVLLVSFIIVTGSLFGIFIYSKKMTRQRQRDPSN